MISRFVATPAALRTFPPDLLDGSAETVRIAERIMRQLGFSELECGPVGSPSERLAWAINALEDDAVGLQEDPLPNGR